MKIHWIGLDTPGRLGISRRPDGGEALDGQMAKLAHGMVDHVVSLLEPAEAADLGLADEGGAAERHGIGFYNVSELTGGLATLTTGRLLPGGGMADESSAFISR